MNVERKLFRLGASEIAGVTHQHLSATPTMLNVHDDEDTSVAAGLANIGHFGGRVIELAHSGKRLLSFELGGETFSVDPNRIFSDAGITATLRQHSRFSEAVLAEVRRFADEYIHGYGLDQERVILALHNTVDGIFSVRSFAPGDYLAAGTAAIHINERRSKFDFFYVTEREFFEALKQADFNVVLQDNGAVADDGSLSVYFAQRKIPYINIEAEMTHLTEQIEMLRVVREVIGNQPQR